MPNPTHAGFGEPALSLSNGYSDDPDFPPEPSDEPPRKADMKFTCIDFETANHRDPSICAAGVVVFEDGLVKQSRYWLVRPPKGHDWFRPEFSECHGITRLDVRNAPEFPAIAVDLLTLLTAADFVVAHHAAFDLRKLRGTLAHFGLPCPSFDCRCTMQLARRVWPHLPSYALDALAANIHYKFQHHNAQADAEAAGRVLLAMMKATKTKTQFELAQTLGIDLSRMA
jgi:DNA polymerase-3 subunit epsilon